MNYSFIYAMNFQHGWLDDTTVQQAMTAETNKRDNLTLERYLLYVYRAHEQYANRTSILYVSLSPILLYPHIRARHCEILL